MLMASIQLIVGIYTHADRHVAVALDTLGRYMHREQLLRDASSDPTALWVRTGRRRPSSRHSRRICLWFTPTMPIRLINAAPARPAATPIWMLLGNPA
jgi:hypothetical protein